MPVQFYDASLRSYFRLGFLESLMNFCRTLFVVFFLVCTYFDDHLFLTHPGQRAVTKVRLNDTASLYFSDL